VNSDLKSEILTAGLEFIGTIYDVVAVCSRSHRFFVKSNDNFWKKISQMQNKMQTIIDRKYLLLYKSDYVFKKQTASISWYQFYY